MGVWSAGLAKFSVPMPDLFSLPSDEARIVLALRLAVATNRQGIDARKAIGNRLGSSQAMIRFLIVMESIGCVWPEPFQIGRACCPTTTPDEILLLQMIRYAAAGNQPGYDNLLCEMIGDDGRQRVFGDIRNFIRVYSLQSTS